ncbi:hypothetical protein AUEXF2481DRAFT_495465 [Aureobasidium subglaciale EXF-2481]|uniref:Uncharacterized protein n=1 Tax=Aureobasidium subglaciale (strain EXF-2481) TaxID=1043005 RepID=A0A074YL98_AURSE|nr:uncharacterized protein AUEXF2481DRAFT_495465 [Aureobasidium subglaciale EXF-2481]KEQ98583.1 hypothetical protein AUEXF2481DRAFT_495465 [Aureobasidium subglaciale EXF-2481]
MSGVHLEIDTPLLASFCLIVFSSIFLPTSDALLSLSSVPWIAPRRWKFSPGALLLYHMFRSGSLDLFRPTYRTVCNHPSQSSMYANKPEPSPTCILQYHTQSLPITPCLSLPLPRILQ